MDRRSSAVLLALLIGVTGTRRPPVAQNSTPSSPRPVAEIQFSQVKPDATIAVELEPGAVSDADSLWVPQRQAGAVIRINPKTNAPGKPIGIGKPLCASLVVAFDSVWAASCEPGAVSRIDVKSGNVSPSTPFPVAAPSVSLATAVGSVWAVTASKGVISRLDPATNAAVAEAYVPANPVGVAAADEAVWVTSEEGDVLTRINARTNVIEETVKVGPKPGRVVIGEGAVWTLNRGDGSVTRVDLKTTKVVTTIVIGESMIRADLALGEGSVWLSAPGVPLLRIDPRTNRVAQRFVGSGGGAVAAGHGSLWVAAGPTLTWRLDPKLVAAMRP